MAEPVSSLGPGDLRVLAAAVAALGDEIVDAAAAGGVARIPVLDGRILDLGVVERDQLDHRGMELVLVAHRRGAAFEIAHIGALVGDDQRALELAGVALVDAEIGRQLHRAAHARRHVDERAVGEHRRVERGEEIVADRHDRAEIFLHQFGMLLQRLRDRHEQHAGLGELGLEGGRDRNGIEHRIDRDAAVAAARPRLPRRPRSPASGCRAAPPARATECRASRRCAGFPGRSRRATSARPSSSARSNSRCPDSRSGRIRPSPISARAWSASADRHRAARPASIRARSSSPR